MKKNYIMMNLLRVYRVSCGILALSVSACQSTANEIVCEPASSPFAALSTDTLDEVALAYTPNVAIDRVCSVHATVVRGQLYTQQVTDGLAFCLRPQTTWHENDGWQIVIGDTTDDGCGQGFNSIVTPPFYGENPIFIVGYQFRNMDNTAENDGSVNAPQMVRSFNFLFSQKEYEIVWAAHNCLTRNQCKNGMTADGAVKAIAAAPKSAAVVTITGLELGNLIPEDHAWIESLEFEARIYLPAE